MTLVRMMARAARAALGPEVFRVVRRGYRRVAWRRAGLLAFADDSSSQNGEDGILAEVFRRIGVVHGACCEVGAWDGIHLSNTRRFVRAGWKAVLIEGDAERLPALVENCRAYPGVSCVQRMITPAGPASISALCRAAGVGELDLLSIDIDGDDADMFAGLEIRPRVVCVETNTLVDPEQRQRAIAPGHTGQSLGVMTDIAHALGYVLVAWTGNAIYVRTEEAQRAALRALDVTAAYIAGLSVMPLDRREHLLCGNLGVIEPYLDYGNPRLSAPALGIAEERVAQLVQLHSARPSRAIRYADSPSQRRA